MTDQSVPPPSSSVSTVVNSDEASSNPYEPVVGDASAIDNIAAPSRAPSLIAKFGAEFFGTFVLIFLGVGAALFAGVLGLGQLGIALAFAIGLTAAIAAVGQVSGGAFNPAVSFGLALSGRISWKELVVHWPAQLAGGAFGALVLWAVAPRQYDVLEGLQSRSRADLFQGAANGFGTHGPGFDGSAAEQMQMYLDQGATPEMIQQALDSGQITLASSMEIGLTGALIIEAVAVAVFVGVILAITDARSKIKFQAVVIGLLLGGLLIVTIPLTNGSINPARSFAAAIFAGDWAWSQLWVFVVAPLLGAAIAALFYRGFAFGVLEETTGEIDGLEGEFFADASAEVDTTAVNLPGGVVSTDIDAAQQWATSAADSAASSTGSDAEEAAATEEASGEATDADGEEPEGDTVLR